MHIERQIGTTYSKFVLESHRATVSPIQIYGRNRNLEWSILQRKQHHFTVVHFQYGVSSRCESPFGITIRFRASFGPLSSRAKPTEIVRVEETSAKGGCEKKYLEREREFSRSAANSFVLNSFNLYFLVVPIIRQPDIRIAELGFHDKVCPEL